MHIGGSNETHGRKNQQEDFWVSGPDPCYGDVPFRRFPARSRCPGGPGVGVGRHHERHGPGRRYQSVCHFAGSRNGVGIGFRRREWDQAPLQASACQAGCPSIRLATRSRRSGGLCDPHQPISGTDRVSQHPPRCFHCSNCGVGKCAIDTSGHHLGAKRCRQYLGVALDRRDCAATAAIPGRSGYCRSALSRRCVAADTSAECARRGRPVRHHDTVGTAAAIPVPAAATSRPYQRRVCRRLQRDQGHGRIRRIGAIGGPVGISAFLGGEHAAVLESGRLTDFGRPVSESLGKRSPIRGC